LELNSYEFSRIDGRSIGHDGLYGYRYLDAYWSEPDRVPYLFRADGELAGLALVRRVNKAMEVSEFLVLPKSRRTGSALRRPVSCTVTPRNWWPPYRCRSTTAM